MSLLLDSCLKLAGVMAAFWLRGVFFVWFCFLLFLSSGTLWSLVYLLDCASRIALLGLISSHLLVPAKPVSVLCCFEIQEESKHLPSAAESLVSGFNNNQVWK